MSTRSDVPAGKGFYLKRGVVYLSFRVKGEKYTYSTGLTLGDSGLKRKLEDFKKEKIAKATAQADAKVERGVRVEDLFTGYLEYLKVKEAEKGEYTTGERTTSDRNAGFVSNHLRPFFGNSIPEQVKKQLDQYKDLRVAEGASAATINGEFRVLRAAMNWGWKRDKVAINDLPKEYPFNYDGERASERTGTITEKQIACISDTVVPHLKPVFLTCIYTGIRPKELRWLKREQVVLDGDDPHILVIKHKTVGKTRKPKVLAIVDELLPVLKEWSEQTKRDYPACEWFFHLNGERLIDWKTAWYGALNRCGIPKGTVIFYDSRRTHSTILDEHDVSRDDRKTQMGHMTDAMDGRYLQSKAHVKRIREAFKGKDAKETEPIAPAASDDVQAKVERLVGMFEKGLLTADEFTKLKTEAMASL